MKLKILLTCKNKKDVIIKVATEVPSKARISLAFQLQRVNTLKKQRTYGWRSQSRYQAVTSIPRELEESASGFQTAHLNHVTAVIKLICNASNDLNEVSVTCTLFI